MVISRRNRAALCGLGALALCGFVILGDWLSAGNRLPEPRLASDVKSLAELESKARDEPGNVINFTRLGAAYKASGRLVEAVSAYVSAAELSPRDPEIQRALVSLKALAEAKGRH
jgi:cytochrome c-type biogenesis protein CcmH/NrfG